MPDEKPAEAAQPEVKEVIVEEVKEDDDDITALFKSTSVEKFSFVVKGKRYKWTYRHITWQEHFKCVEDGYVVKTWQDEVTGFPKEETVFEAARYYEDVFMLALQTGPGGCLITRQILRQLDSPVIQRLTTIVPSPKMGEDLAEAKKASTTT